MDTRNQHTEASHISLNFQAVISTLIMFSATAAQTSALPSNIKFCGSFLTFSSSVTHLNPNSFCYCDKDRVTQKVNPTTVSAPLHLGIMILATDLSDSG